MHRMVTCLAGVALAFQVVPNSAVAASFEKITGFHRTGRSSPFTNLSLSADGSTVAGSSGVGSSFRWTVEHGLEYLDNLPGGSEVRNVIDVSADGSFMLAEGTNHRYVLWRDSGDVLPILDNRLTGAVAISDDASTVVGVQFDPQHGGRAAVRWRVEDGLEYLESLPRTSSSAIAVSGDGRSVTGNFNVIGTGALGFTWHEGDGELVAIPPLPTGERINSIGAISSNGKHLLGYTDVNGQKQAVILRENQPPVHLVPSAGQLRNYAVAVSDNGNQVVGVVTDFGVGNFAFVWDPENGLRDLHTVLSNDYGLADELAGLKLRDIRAMSADGRTILGVAWEQTGPNTITSNPFVVTIPEPATLLLAALALPILIVGIRRRKTGESPTL